MDPFLTALVNLGATGVMAGVFMWWADRFDKDRKRLQDELTALGKRSIEADFTVAASMDKLTSALTGLTSAITSDLQRRP